MTLGLPLAVWPVPLCPELLLRLISPDVDLDAAHEELGEVAPFWGFCWASGQVLARYLLDRPRLVRGRRVVDLGCGSGVVAIAAARAGAARVTAVDGDAHARAAARDNAGLNGVEIATAEALEPALDGCDVLLASDVLYDPTALRLLERAASRVPLTLLSDPERQKLPRVLAPRLERVFEREATTVPDADEPCRRAAVFRLGAAPADDDQQQSGQ